MQDTWKPKKYGHLEDKIMIIPTTKKEKEQQTEIIIDQSEVTMIKYLPTCPKCKLTEDVIFSNVSSKIYQCLRCNLKFRFSDSCPVNTKK